MGTSNPRLVFALAVLLGINTMNFYDRQVGAAVQELLKDQWGLSDRQLGELGTAFILLYAVIGLPLGRLADVWRRKYILALGCGLWSLMTFGSGFALGYWSMFALRLGVGVGEASCAPAANSLIGDLVPAERRARAISVFMLGLPVGLAMSSFFSGSLAQHFGWPWAFFVAGTPGVLLAVAALFIVEPARGAADHHAAVAAKTSASTSVTTTAGAADHRVAVAASSSLSFLGTVARIFSLPTMWWIIASGALHNFNMYALGNFLASLLYRYHAVDVSRAGQITGVIQGFGALGIFLAGWLGDRAYRRGVSGRLHVAWIGLAAAVPCLLMALNAPRGDIWVCAAWLLPGYGLLYFYYGTVYASIQDIIEPVLRGTAMAVYFCGQYLLGAALGPVATGWISDYFARQAALADGAEKITAAHRAVGLHNAMYVVPALDAILVLILFAASLTVKKDYLRRIRREEEAAAGLGVRGNAITALPGGGEVGIQAEPSR
jgi:MFS family permease